MHNIIMSILDRIIYEKNKLVARGDTQKEMELNRKEMELRDKRLMDAQVRKEQEDKIKLAREDAKQRYALKEAEEKERIRYEKRLGYEKSGGLFGKVISTLESNSLNQPRKRVVKRKVPKVKRVVKRKVPKVKKKSFEVNTGKNFKWGL
jgi:hypothetical protein